MTDTIGALRARVTLQAPAQSADDIGGASVSWSDQGAVWAAIEAASTLLRDEFGAPDASVMYRVTLNRRGDIRAGWRLLWGVRVFRITGVRDDGAPRIILDCEEEHL